MDKLRVLFLCVHNSARSQIAEALLKKYASGKFDVMSAGLEPGVLNPYVVEAMKERGIDISRNIAKSAFDLYKQDYLFSYVVTVCDREAAERCPIFPGITTRLHWPFDDPSKFTGTKDEIMKKVRVLIDAMEIKIKDFIKAIEQGKKFKEEDLLTTKN
jgi:arsenate reductase (thioredoxin)